MVPVFGRSICLALEPLEHDAIQTWDLTRKFIGEDLAADHSDADFWGPESYRLY